MRNRKKIAVASLLCISIFSLFLNGCGKKGDDSTAIAITPTPSDTTVAASETPTETPAASLSGASASTNTNGTSSAFSASGNTMVNTGLSGNSADSSNKITGTIVAASMNDVTIRTSEGVEYTCITTSATNNLTNGITLGSNITVTLASMSAVNGSYTATELNELSSTQSNPSGTNAAGLGNALDNGTDGTDTYDDGTYSDGTTYDDGTYDSTLYDDGTYSDYSGYEYDDTSGYDSSGEDYYYYDPATEVYDDSYGY